MVDLFFPGPSVGTGLAIWKGAQGPKGSGPSRMITGRELPEGSRGKVREEQWDSTARKVHTALPAPEWSRRKTVPGF